MTERILVVESDLAVGLDLVMQIEQLGCEVVGLTDRAEDALEIACLLEPGIALIEIAIAGTLDGVHTARLLRRAFQIPTIFLASDLDASTFARAEEAFPIGYLSRRPQSDELKASVEFAIRHMRERKETRQARRDLGELAPKSEAVPV